jgi:hypothetical protein
VRQRGGAQSPRPGEMGVATYRVIGDIAIGSILYKGMLVEFMFDAADLDKVKQHKWHYVANSYIATSIKAPAPAAAAVAEDISGAAAPPALTKKREIYLHTLLMQPGPTQTVYHISKNGLDNRRQNLRLVEGPITQPGGLVRKKRNVELPPMCGLKAEDIPPHIWYVQANGYHRDRFAIEFKSEKILWKSTSSKEVSLQEKLEQSKAKLKALYEQFPHLDPVKEEALARSLKESFEAALGVAHTHP